MAIVTVNSQRFRLDGLIWEYGLLRLITVNPKAVQKLAEVAAQMHGGEETQDLEREKAFAIACAKEAIARKLYLMLFNKLIKQQTQKA